MKYIKWEEHKYLINIPIPYWEYFCTECDNRRISIRWVRYLKYKTIKHKRKQTMLDEMMESVVGVTTDYMIKRQHEWLKTRDYFFPKKG